MVSRSAPQLRRARSASAQPGRRRDQARVRAATAPDDDARRAPRRGGEARRRPPRARRRVWRPGRRVSAEHPGGRDCLPRLRLDRCDLVELLARLRCAQRDRPLRADRATRASRRRRLSLRREGLRPHRRREGAPGRAPERRAHGAARLSRPAARRDRDPRRCCLGGRSSERRRSAAHVRAGRLRPPSLGALQLGNDGAAEGDRPRPRRRRPRVAEEDVSPRRPPGRRPALLVHDHRLDDVELRRQRAVHGRVDRPLRRQPRDSRSRRSLGSRRGCRHHVLRHERRVYRRLSKGRVTARGGPGPVGASLGRIDRVAALPGGLRLGLRDAR